MLDAPGPDHPDEAHGVTDVSDQQSELVKVCGDTVRHQSQLPDTAVELGCSGGKILCLLLSFMLSESRDYFYLSSGYFWSSSALFSLKYLKSLLRRDLMCSS